MPGKAANMHQGENAPQTENPKQTKIALPDIPDGCTHIVGYGDTMELTGRFLPAVNEGRTKFRDRVHAALDQELTEYLDVWESRHAFVGLAASATAGKA